MPDWSREIIRRLADARLAPASEAEIAEELSQHLDDRYAELRALNVPEDEAISRALAELDGAGAALAFVVPSPDEGLDELLHERRGGWFSGMRGDVRYALRALRRAPGYTAVVTATLALGIGVATAAQAIIDPLLLRPLEFSDPERLVTLDSGLLPGEFEIIRDRTTSLAKASLVHAGRAWAIADGEEPWRATGASVTPDFFATLGVAPQLGTLPTDAGEPIAVLAYDLWQTRHGGDASVIGRSITVDGRPVVIAAVMPRAFDYPSRTQVWLLNALDPTNTALLWGGGGFQLIARLHDDATPAAAESEVRGLSSAMSEANPFWTPAADYRANVRVISLHEALVGDVRRSLLLLGAAVMLLLFIACANVANLVLARGLGRARELAVRTALGASPARTIRQLITETVVIASIGGAAGVVLAYVAVGALRGVLPAELPRLAEVGVDIRVLAVSLAVTLLTGLLLGVLPARRATRFDVQESLREGGRAFGGRSGRRLSGTLVVVQVALAVLLVAGAGLLLRSLVALQRIDTGIGSMEVVTARVDLPAAHYARAADRAAFYDALLTRAAALPGVQNVAATSQLPFGGHLQLTAMLVENVTPDPNDLPVFVHRRVTPELFTALGVPLLRGRLLTDADGAPDALPVAVIDASAANEFWPGEDPIGRRLGRPWLREWLTVVGVVGSVLDGELAGTAERTVYTHLQREAPDRAFVVIRSAAGMGSIPSLRNALREVDATVPLSDVTTMRSLITGTLDAQRLATTLLGAFGVLALLLAAVGIYGVLAYAVGQRTQELSLRLALGARAADVLTLVLREGMLLAMLGAALGVTAALGIGRVLRGTLHGVEPHDPLTLGIVCAVVLVVAALAVLGPAMRASRTAPMDALRS